MDIVRFILKLSSVVLLNNKWYLSNYEDVRVSKIKPRTHFTRYGWMEGRFAFEPLRLKSIKKNICRKDVETLLIRHDIKDVSSEIFIQSLRIKSFPR
jgi:hypothetical protein